MYVGRWAIRCPGCTTGSLGERMQLEQLNCSSELRCHSEQLEMAAVVAVGGGVMSQGLSGADAEEACTGEVDSDGSACCGSGHSPQSGNEDVEVAHVDFPVQLHGVVDAVDGELLLVEPVVVVSDGHVEVVGSGVAVRVAAQHGNRLVTAEIGQRGLEDGVLVAGSCRDHAVRPDDDAEPGEAFLESAPHQPCRIGGGGQNGGGGGGGGGARSAGDHVCERGAQGQDVVCAVCCGVYPALDAGIRMLGGGDKHALMSARGLVMR